MRNKTNVSEIKGDLLRQVDNEFIPLETLHISGVTGYSSRHISQSGRRYGRIFCPIFAIELALDLSYIAIIAGTI